MHVRALARLGLPLALLVAGSASAQRRSPAPAAGGATQAGAAAPVPREQWQRVPDIIAALGAGAGSRVADLGAGEGWLTLRLARVVGPEGRVFASDIDANALDRLASAIARDSLRNVEVVLAEDDDPRLPFGTLDGVVILNAYHEMPRRVPVLEGVKRALRPGGLLVIVDNAPTDSTWERREQMARHGLALAFARDDLEAQGFEIVSADARFVERAMDDHVMRQWLLVARRGAR